jgi:hypothetical protein
MANSLKIKDKYARDLPTLWLVPGTFFILASGRLTRDWSEDTLRINSAIDN